MTEKRAIQAQESKIKAIALFSLIQVRKAWSVILDALFPHKCVCGKWGVLLCDECRAQVRVDKTSLCPICKRISENGRTCATCRHKSALTGVMILGPHKGILKELIWKYKYRFAAELSLPLGELVAARFGNFLREKRFQVTFAPIGSARLRWRGFNQAELLATNIAQFLCLECVKSLYKDNNVVAQVGHTRRERLKNIQDKIKYIGPAELASRKILIVDDVYTTGATLEECAKELRRAGYREVWGLVLSRD